MWNAQGWLLSLVILCSSPWAGVVHAEEQTITAEQAREHDGKMVAITMKVKAAKILKDRDLVYLDSEDDYRHENNIAVVLQKETLEALRNDGIENAAEHFKGKTIKVSGKIRVKDKAVRIYVTSATQLTLVEEAVQ